MSDIFSSAAQAVGQLAEQTVSGATSFWDKVNPTGLVGAGLSLVGGLYGNQQSAASAQAAQQFSADQFATRYQTTVKDLEAAGLSPMLAYSQGGGSPPTGVSYQAQNPFAGVSSAYQSGVAGSAQHEQNPFVQGQLSASASQAEAAAKLQNETVAKIKAEVENTSSDTERLKAVVTNLAASTDLLKAQGATQAQQSAFLLASAKKLVQETDLVKFDVQAAKDAGNLGRTMGQYKPIFDVLLSVIHSHR